MNAQKCSPESDPNLGFYPEPGWEWQKPAPKSSLSSPQKAATWILNLVEFVHWLLLIPSFILSFLIFQHASLLAVRLGSELQVYLLSVTPIIQAFAGLVAVVMHEYEGWQVAEFRNPLDTNFKIDEFNNEWLREVTYKMLFFLQTVGLLAFNLGVFGITPLTCGLAAACLAIAFLGPQNPKATFCFYKKPVFPIAWSIASIFIINAAFNFSAYYCLFSKAFTSQNLPGFLSLAAPIFFLLGGVIEGVIAESKFDQWIHFWAVILLNLGLLVQIYSFSLLYRILG